MLEYLVEAGKYVNDSLGILGQGYQSWVVEEKCRIVIDIICGHRSLLYKTRMLNRSIRSTTQRYLAQVK